MIDFASHSLGSLDWSTIDPNTSDGRGWAVETIEYRHRTSEVRVCGWNRYTGEPFDWTIPAWSWRSDTEREFGYDTTGAFVRKSDAARALSALGQAGVLRL